MSAAAPHRVVVAGGAIGRFGRHTDQSLPQITAPVVRAALADANLEPARIQAAFVGNAFGGLITGQESILGQVLLASHGITGIPVHTIKNACSSGSDAVHLAWSAVAYGQHQCVLALGAEKLTHTDRALAFTALASASDHPPRDDGRSVFMDVNAARARRYMEMHGAQPRHFAAVAAKNRRHASFNERAAERQLLTVEEILADRVIVPPLTRSMCSGIVDGAACLVLMTDAFARSLGITATTRMVASVCVSGIPEGSERGNATQRAARLAYEQSGIDPAEVSLAEVHDPTSSQELLDIEDLMLCARGAAVDLVEGNHIALGGRIPVNTSGGLTSRGHPVGATGVAQILEVHEQLLSRAGARQVQGARVGLAQMAGGLLGLDSAVATVHLLTR
jgi:acetyl-CoA acetyltransferase